MVYSFRIRFHLMLMFCKMIRFTNTDVVIGYFVILSRGMMNSICLLFDGDVNHPWEGGGGGVMERRKCVSGVFTLGVSRFVCRRLF